MQARSQNHLAEMLGISKATVSQHAKRGMPTDTLEAAQAWRRKHLDIARRKDVRPAVATAGERLAAHASNLQSAAQTILDSEGDVSYLIPALRHSLAAVPPAARDRVGLLAPVMRVLLADLTAFLPPRDENPTTSCGSPVYIDGATMTDDEAQQAGEFLYQVAAGEFVFKGVSL
jgi:DNA-binding transcriptional regulator YdaS (Cro superfamily)